MIQFNINGYPIQLDDSFKLSFKKTNSMFKWDKFECGRTTEMSIPMTADNCKVLGYVNREGRDTFNDNIVNTTLPAQIIDGIYAADGHFYIAGCDNEKKSFKGVFLFDDGWKIKEMNEDTLRSNVDDYETKYSTWSATKVAANASSIAEWADVAYIDGETTGNYDHSHPSVSVPWLIAQINSYYGSNIIVPSVLNRARLIPYNLGSATFGSQVDLYRTSIYERTAKDILFMVAAASGRMIDIDDGNIQFVEGNISSIGSWEELDADDRILHYGSVKYIPDGWGFFNRFNDAGSALGQKYYQGLYFWRTNYKHGEDVVDIYSAPIQMGAQANTSNDITVTINSNTSVYEGDCIANVRASGSERTMMSYFMDSIGQFTLYGAIASASKTVEVTVRMSLAEYMRLRQRTIVHINGCNYVWFSSEWKDEECKLTLVQF